MDRATADSYIGLLEALYLVVRVPAWSTNVTTQVKRRSTVLLTDTGLAAGLCRAGESVFAPTADGTTVGALFESFVLTELHKQATWNERDLQLRHFRDRHGAEVGLVVEDAHSGQVAGIEVKLTSTSHVRHARHLAMLRDRLGDRFRTGLVIHAGPRTLPLGERLWAVPASTLWRSDLAR